MTPRWLPVMLNLNPWTTTTFDMLYEIFKADFIVSKPYFEGQIVWHFPEKEDGKEAVFWHMTSREDEQGARFPDLRRSERLPWARATIDNASEPEILCWDYLEGNGDIHTYIWLNDFDYIVIMKKYRDGSHRLITAYYIEYPHTKRKLIKKYTKRT